MKNKLNYTFCLIISILSLITVKGQETEKTKIQKEFAPDAFNSTQLINSQTASSMRSKSWMFEVQHRFGKIAMDSSILQQFLGLDLPAVMRFAFGWSFSDRFYVKIGRTNHLKTIDLETKYLLVKQTENFKMPFSLAAYFNAAVRTEKFPVIQKNSYFEDDTTVFYYKPSHRLSYTTQLILSSRITDKFSLQLNPVFVYKNLAPAYNDNFTLSLSAGARYKFGLSTAIIAEYAYVFNNRGTKFYDPMSLGIEFATAGHVFQVFVSTSSKILESHVYTENSSNIGNAEFSFGFNMQRSAWRKHKK